MRNISKKILGVKKTRLKNIAVVLLCTVLCISFGVLSSKVSLKKHNNNKKEVQTQDNIKSVKGDVTWDGDDVVICNNKDIVVTVSLSTNEEANENVINVELKNKKKKTTSYNVNLKAINENIEVDKDCLFYEIKANKKQIETIDYSDIVRMAEISNVYCFDFDITDENRSKKIKSVRVAVKRIAPPENEKKYIPFMGMYAEEQTLISNSEVEVKVHNVGELIDSLTYSESAEHYRGEITYSVINKTEDILDYGILGISINGITIDFVGKSDRLIEKGVHHDSVNIEKDELEKYGIKTINSLSMYISYVKAAEDDVQYVDSKDKYDWYEVKLKKRGRKTGSLGKDNQLIYKSNGIKITYSSTDHKSNEDMYYWKFNIINNTNKNIYLRNMKSWTNGKFVSKYDFKKELSMNADCVGAKQKGSRDISIDSENYKNKKAPSVIKVKFLIIDNDTEEVLGKTEFKTVKYIKRRG